MCTWCGCPEKGIGWLEGKTLKGVYHVNEDKDEIFFVVDNEQTLKMYHSQD